jgi:hypothetical protein
MRVNYYILLPSLEKQGKKADQKQTKNGKTLGVLLKNTRASWQQKKETLKKTTKR